MLAPRKPPPKSFPQLCQRCLYNYFVSKNMHPIALFYPLDHLGSLPPKSEFLGTTLQIKYISKTRLALRHSSVLPARSTLRQTNTGRWGAEPSPLPARGPPRRPDTQTCPSRDLCSLSALRQLMAPPCPAQPSGSTPDPSARDGQPPPGASRLLTLARGRAANEHHGRQPAPRPPRRSRLSATALRTPRAGPR